MEYDSLLLFTDGIPEAQNPKGICLDEGGISDWLVSLRGVGMDRLADSLLQRLRDWRGDPTFEDDVTLVVARMAAPDSHI